MSLELSRDEEIAAFVEEVLRDESTDFKRRFIAALSHLDAAGWSALEQMTLELAREKDAAPAPRWTEEEHKRWEAEARAEAEELYREILQEKKAAAESSAFPSDGGEYDPGGGRLA